MSNHEVTGSVTQTGKEKWQMEVNLGYFVDPKTGKNKRNRKYKTIKAKNQRQAEIQLAKWIAELTSDSYFEPEKMNFVDFVRKEWEPKCARRRLASTTYEQYVKCAERRILPAFQYLRLDQIKPKHIMDFLDNLSEEGMRLDGKEGPLSSSQIEYHHRVLKHIFNFAEEIKIIKENPIEPIKKPQVEYQDVEIYTDEEASRLLECLESETHVPHWQIIIKLAIITGMRRSELCGLEFKHFDYETNMVRIRQALTYTKTSGYDIHEIKKGNRTARQRDVSLPEDLMKAVKKLELSRKAERFAFGKENLWKQGKHNFILSRENGHPYNPSSVKRWWERFIKRHNLKYIRLHALRHTSATLLINLGVHPRTISERLGHSNFKVTMNRYGHAVKEVDKLATDKLADALKTKKVN